MRLKFDKELSCYFRHGAALPVCTTSAAPITITLHHHNHSPSTTTACIHIVPSAFVAAAPCHRHESCRLRGCSQLFTDIHEIQLIRFPDEERALRIWWKD
eukprot:scaffold116894_cov80-Cyclotella_meneghiniana.AAC.7